jgi:sugar/nucleoside kinase (ribokinase family)
MAGKTFHWQGKYSYDLNARETICTDLNVFELFKPKIPARYRESEYVFLGNIDPVLQGSVLDQVERPKVVACDTMNFWISGKPAELRKTLAKVDVLLVNDAEVRELSGEWNVVKGARAIRAMGPKVLIVKKGEHGVLMFGDAGSFAAPAFPLEDVFDPTGAGDAFAGGFMGHVARTGNLTPPNLRLAMVYGSVMGSFAVERFSVQRFEEIDRDLVLDRVKAQRALVHFDVEPV